MPSPSTSPDLCDVTDCSAAAGVLIHAGQVALPLRQALLGYEESTCYQDWADRPRMYFLCQKHHRYLLRRDGYTLGYRKHNGKIRAYVIEQHF
jgi:hypothetical protein